MDECERLKNCPFFLGKMANMPATAELMKNRYCRSDYEKCARYILFKANINVPADLYPDEIDVAQEILNKNKK